MRTRSRTKWANQFMIIIALASAGIALYAYYMLTSAFLSKEGCDDLYTKWYEYMPNTYIDVDTPPSSTDINSLFGYTPEQYNQLIDAFRSYEEPDFEEAETQFSRFFTAEEMKNHPDLLFFYSLTLMENNKQEEAIGHLSHLSSLEDINYKDEAGWYLALAYLKDCRLNEAKKQLLLLREKAGKETYKEKASQLFEIIKSYKSSSSSPSAV